MAILIDFARVVIWECFLETDYIAEELTPSGAMRLVPLFALQTEGQYPWLWNVYRNERMGQSVNLIKKNDALEKCITRKTILLWIQKSIIIKFCR